MNTTRKTYRKGREDGVVLMAVMLTMMVLGLLVGAFMEAAANAWHSAKTWKQSDAALASAISAMDKAKWDIYEAFNEYFESDPTPRSSGKFDWFESYGDHWLGNEDPYRAPEDKEFDGSTVTVTIADIKRVDRSVVDIILRSQAKKSNSQRTVEETVRYSLDSARVFDYAYFVNNYGWLWGGSITAHGNVRANADFSCKYGPDINGDAYASLNPNFGAPGTVHGGWDSWSLSKYYRNAPDQARPGNPPSSSYPGYWTMGYDADAKQYEEMPVLPMPYLGDLNWYEQLAAAHGTDGSWLRQEPLPGEGDDDDEEEDGRRVVSGELNINPNNSPHNEFSLTKGDGGVITRDDLHKKAPIDGNGTYYEGPATLMHVNPKGNGNQNTFYVDGEVFPLKNSETYDFSGDMTVRVYNDKPKKGKAMGHWWVATGGFLDKGDDGDDDDDDEGEEAVVDSGIIVDEVYNGPGPDGASGTPDDGMLVLWGTEDRPLEISGPVVVHGDVAIRGYITGQGTIYSGRNIHVAGELTYVNPPNWPKPDDDPEGTVSVNQEADMLGLAAKGNIILGNYTDSTWYNKVRRYIRPGFTHAYDTDPSDYENGYDSDWNPNNGHRFDGNYTGKDGSQRIDADGNITDRRYYQSSNDQAFLTLEPTNDIHKIDAVNYTNHLFSGHTHEMNFNGAIVARDEGIIFQNYVKMTWDIRLGSPRYDGARINFALPQTLAKPNTLYWREL